MRKIILLAIAVLALACTAVALAATNTYRVSGSVSPTNAGTTKKPVPVKVGFSYQIGEVDNQRPNAVRQYKIDFSGLHVNTSYFKACSAQAINAAGGNQNCSPKAVMGSGNIQAVVGPSNDQTNQSLSCYLALTFYNAGKNHAALYLKGDSAAADPSKACITDISQAIDASFIRNSKGTTLQFNVPSSLLHPINGFDVAVKSVTSTILRKTAKVHGKTRGFFESVGGCKSNKRAITVSFTPEAGPSGRAQAFAKCKK